MTGERKGEFDTSEFFETCLKLVLVRLGEFPSVSDGLGDGLSGEVTESRLLIWSGDQPFAEEEMIDFRVVSGVDWTRSR